MEVVRGGGEPGQLHRLIWCPYLPDPGEEDPEDSSAARLLVLTQAGRAEVWSLDMVAEAHGSGPLSPQDVESGLLAIDEVGLLCTFVLKHECRYAGRKWRHPGRCLLP